MPTAFETAWKALSDLLDSPADGLSFRDALEVARKLQSAERNIHEAFILRQKATTQGATI